MFNKTFINICLRMYNNFLQKFLIKIGYSITKNKK